MKWVMYEVWTTAYIVEADTEAAALEKSGPPREGMILGERRVVPLSADEPKKDPNAYKPWGRRYQNPLG